MDDPLAGISRFFRELKRRNVYKVGVTYLVVAFVGFQVAQMLIPATRLPPWADEFFLFFLVVGFPVALVVAWAFEMTPEGVRRTPTAEGGEGPLVTPGEEEAASGRDASRLAAKGLVGLGIVAAAVAGVWYLTAGGGQRPEVAERTVAVLPFEVTGSAAETWRDGMVTLLNTGLDGAGGLRAISDRTVFAAWETSDTDSGGTSTEEALAVAREIGAQYAVVGSAVQVGGHLRFLAEIHETESADRVGRAEVRGSPDSVTSLSDSLTRRVLGVLLESEDEGLPHVDLGSVTTQSLPALKSFLAGERHLRATEYEAAIDDYRAAVEADSTFALAHLRLGRAQGWTLKSEARERSWERAYRLSDRLPARERGVARAAYLRARGRMAPARDTLRRLADDYPDDPTVWYNLGEVLWHGYVPRGWREADRAFERAVQLDPGHFIYYPHYLQLGISVHDDSALAAQRIASAPDPQARAVFRAVWELAYGDPDRRQDVLSRLDTFPVSAVVRLGPGHALRPPVHGGGYEELIHKLGEWRGVPRVATVIRARAKLEQGQVREGLDAIRGRGRGTIADCLVAWAMSVGTPVPDSVARRLLAPERLPADAPVVRLSCTGLYVIERDRADALDALLGRIRAVADTATSPGPTARQAETVIDELRGYRAWRAGELERAARLFGASNASGSWGALWRGDVHRGLGELGEAEGWYQAAWPHPVAHERLGQLYEEMGERRQAVEAYRRFLAAWEDADPNLQGRVERARQRLRELAGGGAGSTG